MFGFFKKLFSPLSQKIRNLFSKGGDLSFDALEQLFYEADLGASVTTDLVDKIRARYRRNPMTPEEILRFVKEELTPLFPAPKPITLSSPHVILIVGVNGSGKTTSLAKLASYYRAQGKKVLIAAGDTFRAAAIEQLELWAGKIGADFIKSQPNSDPSGVAFDALAAATARKSDIVLIDTAGRLHTKRELMDELAKIRRVCHKRIEGAPHETLLVLDATIGQNALDQARTFHSVTPITGIVLSKLDGTAKGGIAVAIQKELGIPILWVGTGEREGDFTPFDASSYLNSLLGLE